MNMLRAVIVEDELRSRETLLGLLKLYCKNLEVIGEAENVQEGLQLIQKSKPDVVFLDIQMPDGSGFKLLEQIENLNFDVIFTTAYDQFAIKAIRYSALDYLLKPISFERLIQSISKYQHEHIIPQLSPQVEINTEKSDFIFVRSERKMIKINFSDLDYIESLSDYLKLYTNDKLIVTRETISSIEAKLPKHDFLRVHRSYIVAISKIESFTQEFIEIKKKAIPISRTYKNDVKLRLDNV